MIGISLREGEGTDRTAAPSTSSCHLSFREICPEILWTFAISKKFSHFLAQSCEEYKCWWIGAGPKQISKTETQFLVNENKQTQQNSLQSRIFWDNAILNYRVSFSRWKFMSQDVIILLTVLEGNCSPWRLSSLRAELGLNLCITHGDQLWEMSS